MPFSLSLSSMMGISILSQNQYYERKDNIGGKNTIID
jgi:hypothetical protein